LSPLVKDGSFEFAVESQRPGIQAARAVRPAGRKEAYLGPGDDPHPPTQPTKFHLISINR